MVYGRVLSCFLAFKFNQGCGLQPYWYIGGYCIIGVIEYTIDEETIELGKLQKSHWLNAIILIAKEN